MNGEKDISSLETGPLVAFTLGARSRIHDGFRIVGSHSDSPALKIKPRAKVELGYTMLGIEQYGSPVLAGWFDRELSIAGNAVVLDQDNKLETILVDFKKPLAYIPSLAIHLNRAVNDGIEINVQNHMSPILSQSTGDAAKVFDTILFESLKKTVPEKNIAAVTGFDLFCYDPGKSSYFGSDQEFISAPRLDNLLSCFTGLESIKNAGESTNTFFICANHEEIGSRSESGALGSFVSDIFERICKSSEDKSICLYNHSFLLSLDNAHAHHPHYQDKSDTSHEIRLNAGPVIKLNANQRYTSTSKTASIMRCLASESNIMTQDFVMRSDMPCGSTIGPLISSRLGIPAVDIGAPTWGMHAIREVTGTNDPYELYTLTSGFLNRETLYS